MPFVRTSRDKRGYEHIYLIDTPIKRGRPSVSRVLYWFRTPPGVKVGREPFDEATRRTLETQYPNLIFDWKKLANTPMPPPDTEHWRERRRLERSARQARAAEEREDEAALATAAAAVTANDVMDTAPTSIEPLESAESIENLEDSANPENPANLVNSANPENSVNLVNPVNPEQRRRRRRGGRRRRRAEGAPEAQTAQIPDASPGIAASPGNVADLSPHHTASPDLDGSTLDPHEEE